MSSGFVPRQDKGTKLLPGLNLFFRFIGVERITAQYLSEEES